MADAFWERAARQDPLWAILSDPVMRGRRWRLRDFFESGAREITLLDYQLRRLGRAPAMGRALDFGCGVGRLTLALATRFTEVIGVDVSPTMIDLARRLNRHPERVRYLLNQAPDLGQIPSGTIDFVYSDIVLQHLEPERSRVYISEFMRVLADGGIAVFQLPSCRRPPSEISDRPVSMPIEAYRAAISLVDGPPRTMAPEETATVVVDVTNASTVNWDRAISGALRLGNHWRSAAGDMLIQDDGRASLEAMFGAGRTQRVAIKVQAPPDAGSFLCEFDLVHEGISWFVDRGSRAVSAPVAVTASDPASASTQSASAAPAVDWDRDFPDIYEGLPASEGEDIGAFPMFGISRADVLALVEAHGGRAFFIEADERGGPEWEGFRYYVAKAR